MLSLDLPGCRTLSAEVFENHVVVVVEGEASRQACPGCGHESVVVHSRYLRRPRDLPVQGRPVRLLIVARRWRCSNRDCSRKTFNESFAGLVQRHAQRTGRMTELMRHLIVNQSSTVAERLAEVIGIDVSGRTLLRVVGNEEVHVPTPRVVGLDDFALRRGVTYGTIFCDLEKGKPIDIVVGRTKQDVLRWLQNHPGIEIAARDRASSYADALSVGAPGAIQVADRFHLVKNLSDALKEVVDRQSWALPEPAPLPVSASEPDLAPEPELTPERKQAPGSPSKRAKRAAAAERLERRYSEVIQLHADGMPVRKIAKVTGFCRATIRKYLASVQVPKRAERRRVPSMIDPFMDYLEERWESGCHNVHALWVELAGQGFTGSESNLRRVLGPWRAELPKAPRKGRKRVQKDNCTPKTTWKEVRWALLRFPEHLSDVQRQLLQEFLPLHPELSRARDLIERFRRMLKEHDSASFETWVKDASESALAPFERLARTFESDRLAVIAGIELPWSTGPVEGQITRVKLLKRIGYGRAGLALLRARILGCA